MNTEAARCARAEKERERFLEAADVPVILVLGYNAQDTFRPRFGMLKETPGIVHIAYAFGSYPIPVTVRNVSAVLYPAQMVRVWVGPAVVL